MCAIVTQRSPLKSVRCLIVGNHMGYKLNSWSEYHERLGIVWSLKFFVLVLLISKTKKKC